MVSATARRPYVPKPPAERNPNKQRAGTIGAQRRWAGHTPRLIRLADLGPDQRRAILAYLEVAKAAEDQAEKGKAVDGNPITSTALATTEGRSSASSSD